MEGGEEEDDDNIEIKGLDEAVVYAGEACSVLNRGTTHGAYKSGLVAASVFIDRKPP
jgi:hypothetical protein